MADKQKVSKLVELLDGGWLRDLKEEERYGISGSNDSRIYRKEQSYVIYNKQKDEIVTRYSKGKQ